MKKRCGKGMLVLLMAALVSVGGIGAACFFSRQAGKEKFQEEEAEKLKAEREYLEAGAPEKTGPYPEYQSESGKMEKREELQDTETEKEKKQKAEEDRKKKEEEKRQREEAEARIKKVEKMLAKLYDPDSDSVAMNTSKNSKIFQNAQTEMWKLPLSYDRKRQEFQKIVDRISDEWDYINDDLHYETETLKISVQEKDTGYTKYWVCHVETFSPRQLCSALCGGTYGNPRKPVSEELAAHNGVIGVNHDQKRKDL